MGRGRPSTLQVQLTGARTLCATQNEWRRDEGASIEHFLSGCARCVGMRARNIPGPRRLLSAVRAHTGIIVDQEKDE